VSIRDADVKAIIDTKRDCTPFINAANIVVSEVLGASNLSAPRIDLITQYLAAHFCSLTEEQGGLVSSQIAGAKEEYVPISSYRDALKGFQITRYGQQALALDTTGQLAASTANYGMKALFRLFPQRRDPSWTGDQSAV
jgi:hypothetical protein